MRAVFALVPQPNSSHIMAESNMPNDVLDSVLVGSGAEIEYKAEKRTYTFRSDEEVSEILQSIRADIKHDQSIQDGDESSASSDDAIDHTVDTFEVDKWVREFYFSEPKYRSGKCPLSTGPLCIIPSTKRRRIAASPQHADECKSGFESVHARDVLPAEEHEIETETHLNNPPPVRSRRAPSSSAGRSSSLYKSIMKDLHPKSKPKPKTGAKLPATGANGINGVESRPDHGDASAVSAAAAASQSSSKPPSLAQYKLSIDRMRLENSSDESFMTEDDAMLWSEIVSYIVAYKPIGWTEISASLSRGVKYCRDRWFDVLSPAITYRRKRFKEMQEGQIAGPFNATQPQPPEHIPVVKPLPQRSQLAERQQIISQHHLLSLVSHKPPQDSPQEPHPGLTEQPQRDAPSATGVIGPTPAAPATSNQLASHTCTPRVIGFIISANPMLLEQTRRNFAAATYGDRSAPGAFSTFEDAVIVLTLRTTNDAAPWWGALDARLNRPAGSCERRWNEVKSIVDRQRDFRGLGQVHPVQQRAMIPSAVHMSRNCNARSPVQPTSELDLAPPIRASPPQSVETILPARTAAPYQFSAVAPADTLTHESAPAPPPTAPIVSGGAPQSRASDVIVAAMTNRAVRTAFTLPVHLPKVSQSVAVGALLSAGTSSQPPSRLNVYNLLRAIEEGRPTAVYQFDGRSTGPNNPKPRPNNVPTIVPLPPGAAPAGAMPHGAAQ